MLISFVLATIIITLVPGPSMLLVIITAIQRNFVSSVFCITGVVIADAVLLLLAMSGLGTLIHTSSSVFLLVKWLGAGYLIYLGLKQFGSAGQQASSEVGLKKGNSFIQGFTTTILNPKIIGFFIAFFPQFINNDSPLLPQLIILGPLFLLVVFQVLVLYAVLASTIKHMLSKAKFRRKLSQVSGLTLLGCGLLTALAS